MIATFQLRFSSGNSDPTNAQATWFESAALPAGAGQGLTCPCYRVVLAGPPGHRLFRKKVADFQLEKFGSTGQPHSDVWVLRRPDDKFSWVGTLRGDSTFLGYRNRLLWFAQTASATSGGALIAADPDSGRVQFLAPAGSRLIEFREMKDDGIEVIDLDNSAWSVIPWKKVLEPLNR